MTSEEIAVYEIETRGEISQVNIQVECDKFKMLREIAYQLAKLNEHFEKVDGEVFNGKKEKKS